jgi:hypothetical protein
VVQYLPGEAVMIHDSEMGTCMQDMGLKRTSATSVPPNDLVHSKMRIMRTIEDTSRTSATKWLGIMFKQDDENNNHGLALSFQLQQIHAFQFQSHAAFLDSQFINIQILASS